MSARETLKNLLGRVRPPKRQRRLAIASLVGYATLTSFGATVEALAEANEPATQNGSVQAYRAPEKPLNILLLSVDTLRSDALSAYGFPGNISPNLDALAERGVLFEDALTTIGKTGPAFASLFSGHYPATHGARRNGIPIRPEVPVLPEILQRNGYQTAGFITNWTLKGNLAGLNRGFDHYDQNFTRNRYVVGPKERDARSVIEETLSWLKANRNGTSSESRDDAARGSSDKPLFLWLHLSEPHTPYQLHREFAPPKPRAAEQDPMLAKKWRYASEVGFTDHWIQQFLKESAQYLPREETLILFVSDHGESIGEHNYWGHGKNTHWANLRVPLFLVGPGLPAGVRTRAPASLIDLLPTVLEMLELPKPKDLPGQSLVDSWTRPVDSDRSRYSFGDRATARDKSRFNYEDPLEVSVERQGIKAIYDFTRKRVRYFDLAKDPAETNPLSAPPRRFEPSLARQIVSWYKELSKYDGQGTGDLTPEDIEQLKSLGYVDN